MNSYKKPDPITEEDFPLVSISQNGLHVESEKISQRLDRVSLSPSTIAALEQCPAKWVFEKFVKNEVLPEDDDTPGRRGSVFHDIMEEFFRIEPPEYRSTTELARITKQVISEKYPNFKNNPEVIQWVKDAIKGYYQMGAKPQNVNVANIPKQNNPEETEKGLEIFVKGKLGEATRETLGFVDQVLESAKDGGESVVVSDWKSGSRYKVFKKTTKSNDGFNELRQQIIYSMLLEQRDVKVSSARLVYPVAGAIVKVDVNDEELRVRIIDSITEADRTLDVSIENNTFEYGPSFLCSWCPLSKVCPVAELKPFKKATDAYAQQPSAEDLKGSVEFK